MFSLIFQLIEEYFRVDEIEFYIFFHIYFRQDIHNYILLKMGIMHFWLKSYELSHWEIMIDFLFGEFIAWGHLITCRQKIV